MSVERKVFRGVGAVIASVETDRKFEIAPKLVWPGPTDFQRSKRIPIDLDRCPSKVGRWSDIQVDDRGVDEQGEFLGSALCPSQLVGYHVTNLGGYAGPGLPEYLSRGPFVGAVYLENAFFEEHRSKIDLPGNAWPTTGVKPCQTTTVAYSNSADNGARRNKRYAGFLGRLTKVTAGSSLVTVELLRLDNKPFEPYDFDLSSADHCDPDPPLSAGETLLRVDSPVPAIGTIFVELRYIAQLRGIDNPKLPIGMDS